MVVYMLPLKYAILDIITQNFSVFIILNRQAYPFQFNSALLWTIFRKVIRTIEPSDYWALRLPGLRTIGPSDYRILGLLGLRTIGRQSYQTIPVLCFTHAYWQTNCRHQPRMISTSDRYIYLRLLLFVPDFLLHIHFFGKKTKDNLDHCLQSANFR